MIGGWVVASEFDPEARVMLAEADSEAFRDAAPWVVECDEPRSFGGKPPPNRRADPARADDQAIHAGEVKAFAHGAAGEPDAIEHIAKQRSVRPAQNRIT